MKLLKFATGRLRKKDAAELETFEDLLESNLTGLYRVALSLTKNPVLAEDLVHDTCVRALRFKDRFEMGTNFRAWIFTVQHHTFIHRYRRKKREREILEGATRGDVQHQFTSDQARAKAMDPENAYLDSLLSDDVLVALEAIPADYRMVVTLCDLEGLSYKEIADIIEAPVGTVMSRLYRGRRLLEKRLRHVAIERGILKADSGDSQTTESADAIEPSTVVELKKYRRRHG